MKYLILKPATLIDEDEISKLMNGTRVNFLDPTINQENSDLYDDIAAAYTIKNDDDITWKIIQLLEVDDEVNSTFLSLKYSEIILGRIELDEIQKSELREHRITIDRFLFYGKPENDKQRKSLDVAMKKIVMYLIDSW